MYAASVTSLKRVWMVSLCAAFLSGVFPLVGAVKKGEKEEVFPALAVSLLGYVDRDGESLNASGKVIRIGVYDRGKEKRVWGTFESLCEKQPERYRLYDLTEVPVGEVGFDLIYIASGRSEELPLDLLRHFSDQAVLVVGEHEELLESGGIVRFKTSNRKNAEFGLNLKQAKLVGLSIRSQLARRATEVIR